MAHRHGRAPQAHHLRRAEPAVATLVVERRQAPVAAHVFQLPRRHLRHVWHHPGLRPGHLRVLHRPRRDRGPVAAQPLATRLDVDQRHAQRLARREQPHHPRERALGPPASARRGAGHETGPAHQVRLPQLQACKCHPCHARSLLCKDLQATVVCDRLRPQRQAREDLRPRPHERPAHHGREVHDAPGLRPHELLQGLFWHHHQPGRAQRHRAAGLQHPGQVLAGPASAPLAARRCTTATHSTTA